MLRLHEAGKRISDRFQDDFGKTGICFIVNMIYCKICV